MDILIGWNEWETEFLGDKVKCNLYPLENEHMLLLLPELSKIQEEKNQGAISKLAFEFQKHAAIVFPNHVEILSGVTVQGQKPTNEQLATLPIFVSLTLEILSQLVVMSSEASVQGKNLEGQSGSLATAE